MDNTLFAVCVCSELYNLPPLDQKVGIFLKFCTLHLAPVLLMCYVEDLIFWVFILSYGPQGLKMLHWISDLLKGGSWLFTKASQTKRQIRNCFHIQTFSFSYWELFPHASNCCPPGTAKSSFSIKIIIIMIMIEKFMIILTKNRIFKQSTHFPALERCKEPRTKLPMHFLSHRLLSNKQQSQYHLFTDLKLTQKSNLSLHMQLTFNLTYYPWL